jgi:uncharacterized protein YoxC
MSWLNMNLLFDISFLVFFIFLALKFKSLDLKNKEIKSDLDNIRRDLNITMINPQHARRVFKKRSK